ncbi:MAG: PstS family phosphate ABC transporter substrate-binding protein [bacterium]
MKRTILAFLILVIAAGTVFAGDITMSGSTTVFPIAQLAAERFMENNEDINISVRGGGSGVGITDIMLGRVDIGNASRSIKTKELKQAKENGINIVETVVANDGIAIVINPSNGINELTLEQAKKIFTGEISNWKQLGGKSMPIVAISRDVSSGTFEVFKELVLRGGKVREDALLLASNNAVASNVAETPGAIGYIGFGFLSDKIKALKIDNVEPSEKTVNDGTYKIARKLYMYTNGSPKGEVKSFIDFILSEDGQEIVKETGYIPLK